MQWLLRKRSLKLLTNLEILWGSHHQVSVHQFNVTISRCLLVMDLVVHFSYNSYISCIIANAVKCNIAETSLLCHVNEKTFFPEQFKQHRSHTINQDVLTRGSSSAEQLSTGWNILIYCIYDIYNAWIAQKNFSFTQSNISIHRVILCLWWYIDTLFYICLLIVFLVCFLLACRLLPLQSRWWTDCSLVFG